MSDDVLLRGFAITHVMDCIADPTKNRIIAEFWDRVDEVFPYLNAVIPNLMFNPGANTVTFRRGGRIHGEYRTGAFTSSLDNVNLAVSRTTIFLPLVLRQ